MQVQNYISKAVFNIFDFLLREISIKISAIILGETLEIEKSKLTESEKKHCKTVAR